MQVEMVGALRRTFPGETPMDLSFVILGGVAVAAFVMVFMVKRSSGYRSMLNQLENENNLIEMRIHSVEEEREQVKSSLAVLKGRLKAHEEAVEAQKRAVSDAALQREQARAETFLEYLVRQGIVTKEHLVKVKAYKEKNASQNSVEELLIMLDFISLAVLQQAKAAYEAGKVSAD